MGKNKTDQPVEFLGTTGVFLLSPDVAGDVWGVFLLSPDVAGVVWGVGGVSVES